MSQASKITLLLFVTAFVVTVNCNTCSVKPMEKGVDLNRLAGTTWYQMLNADDPIDRVTPCYVMKFGEATEDGISFEFVMLDPSNLGRVETSYQQFYKEGQAFRFKMENEKKWLKASLKQALDKPKMRVETRRNYSITSNTLCISIPTTKLTTLVFCA
uniref:uncharacterized protein LOC120340069 n=1 Tax=Styela clava TaxID=7725 RepID=UPI00193968D0|nr:uncharacterized protein LOC120340069 [Styela clava]